MRATHCRTPDRMVHNLKAKKFDGVRRWLREMGIADEKLLSTEKMRGIEAEKTGLLGLVSVDWFATASHGGDYVGQWN